MVLHELGMLPTPFRAKTGRHSMFCSRVEHNTEGDPDRSALESHTNTGRRDAGAAQTQCGKGTGRSLPFDVVAGVSVCVVCVYVSGMEATW